MWDARIREKARRLRSSGKFIDAIAEQLGVSRSTIYVWIKGIAFTGRSERQLAARQLGSKRMQAKYAELRQAAYDAADLQVLENDLIVRDFVVMYLGEGYRRNRNVVHICNTNPAVMLMSIKALRRLKVDLNAANVSFKLLLYPDHEDLALKRFWTKQLQIQSCQIKIWRPAKKQQPSKYRRSVRGLMYMTINDTYLRARLQAFMDAVEADWKLK